MKKAFVFIALSCLPLGQRTIQAQNARVDVLSISVGKPLSQAQKDVFLFTHEGTQLQLGISLPGRTFIGEDREQCKFEQFTDDKGNDLYAPLGHAPEADDWMGSFGPKFSADGKLCGLQVDAPGLPANGSTKLHFKGTLVLSCGVQPKTAEQKNVALKKGFKITAGPVPFEVTKMQVEGSDTKLEIKAYKSLDRIIKIAFFDAKGKEIQSQREGYDSGSVFGNFSITQYFDLKGKVTLASVKISYFDKVENVTVPLNIEAGLGL